MSQSLNSSRINSQNMPPGASKSLKYPFTLPANGQLTFDLQQQQASGQIENIQSVFIDNSGNASAITLYSSGPNFNVVCPPYSQGMFPILVSSVARFVLSGSGSGALYFLNVPMPLSVWPVANANTYSGGALVVSDTILDGTVSNGRVNTGPELVTGANQTSVPLLAGTRTFTAALNATGTNVLIAAQANLRFFVSSLYIYVDTAAYLSAAGFVDVNVLDGAGVLLDAASFSLGAAAPTTPTAPLLIASCTDLDYISSAQDQALNISISSAILGGFVRFTAFGGYTNATP